MWGRWHDRCIKRPSIWQKPSLSPQTAPLQLANLICSYPKVIRDWETGRSFDVDSVCMLNIGKLFGIPIESLIDDDLRRIYKSRK